jgi:hypothetical protein
VSPPAGSSSSILAPLPQIAASWTRRAAIRKHATIPLDPSPGREDLPVELLPFADHPTFRALSDAQRSRVLSCGWLAYNEKIVAVESNVVMPACLDAYEGRIPTAKVPSLYSIVAETLVDESYHIKLHLHANDRVQAWRKLDEIRIPPCTMVTRMRALQAREADDWKRVVIQFVSAAVTEIFVSGYLRTLAGAEQLQPMTWMTTRMHLADELTHASIFKILTREVVHRLDETRREYLLQVLPLPVYWFADAEIDVWDSLLEQLGVVRRAEMLGDVRATLDRSKIDVEPLVQLFEELGIAGVRERIMDAADAAHAAPLS